MWTSPERRVRGRRRPNRFSDTWVGTWHIEVRWLWSEAWRGRLVAWDCGEWRRGVVPVAEWTMPEDWQAILARRFRQWRELDGAERDAPA